MSGENPPKGCKVECDILYYITHDVERVNAKLSLLHHVRSLKSVSRYIFENHFIEKNVYDLINGKGENRTLLPNDVNNGVWRFF